MEGIDLDSLEPSFPPAVTRDGMMLSYEQIFPYAERLCFLGVDDQPWVVDDNIACNRIAIALRLSSASLPTPGDHRLQRIRKHIPLREPVTEEAAIRYDTKTGHG